MAIPCSMPASGDGRLAAPWRRRWRRLSTIAKVAFPGLAASPIASHPDQACMRAALRVTSLLSRQHPTRCMSATALPLSGAKRDRMVQIGTHSGSFHCDEALGCFLLKQTAKFGAADVVRTRDPEVLKTLDVVIDVGGVYEPGEAVRRWASGGHMRWRRRWRRDSRQCRSRLPCRASASSTCCSNAPFGSDAWKHLLACPPHPHLLPLPPGFLLPGRPAAACPCPLQSLTAMTTTSGASPRSLATASTQSCPVQVSNTVWLLLAMLHCLLLHQAAASVPTFCALLLLLPASPLLACLPLPDLPAGLVYKHYGREIVAGAMQLPVDHADVEVSCAVGGCPPPPPVPAAATMPGDGQRRAAFSHMYCLYCLLCSAMLYCRPSTWRSTKTLWSRSMPLTTVSP